MKCCRFSKLFGVGQTTLTLHLLSNFAKIHTARLASSELIISARICLRANSNLIEPNSSQPWSTLKPAFHASSTGHNYPHKPPTPKSEYWLPSNSFLASGNPWTYRQDDACFGAGHQMDNNSAQNTHYTEPNTHHSYPEYSEVFSCSYAFVCVTDTISLQYILEPSWQTLSVNFTVWSTCIVYRSQ